MENIHNYNVQLRRGHSFQLLVLSDVHFDSKKCDRKLLRRHLNAVVSNGGKIIIIGDLFDLMGAKRDPRSVPNDIRPEYMESGATYLDLVIKDLHKFFTKYAEHILMIGYGNHETNIERRQQTDPLKWLLYLLNRDLEINGLEHRVQLGGYQGAFNLKFLVGKSSRLVKSIFYHHGSGGGAKRSKGILNADILVSQNPWADVIVSGHDHNKWHLPFTIRSLNHKRDTWINRTITILRTGSYKMKSRSMGWEVEKDFNEPTLGGWLINFKSFREHNTATDQILVKVEDP
jgi:hypothetical protein